MTASPQRAAQRWAAELDAWRIDPEILASVEENPYTFPPRLFAAREDADAAPSPLADLAREALPPGGSVLDVGAGAGAGSLGLAGRVGHLHAVDAQPSMLAALEESAACAGHRADDVRRQVARPGSPRCRCATSWSARTSSTTCRTWRPSWLP